MSIPTGFMKIEPEKHIGKVRVVDLWKYQDYPGLFV
jgi:hypothetical protein